LLSEARRQFRGGFFDVACERLQEIVGQSRNAAGHRKQAHGGGAQTFLHVQQQVRIDCLHRRRQQLLQLLHYVIGEPMNPLQIRKGVPSMLLF
jgi:hypothetical protein